MGAPSAPWGPAALPTPRPLRRFYTKSLGPKTWNFAIFPQNSKNRRFRRFWPELPSFHETPKRGGLGGFSRFAGPFDEISGFSKKNPKKFSFGYLTATFDGLPRRPQLGQFHGFAGPFKIFGFFEIFSKNSEQGTFPFSHAGRFWGTKWGSLLPECPCLHFFRRRGSVWGALGSFFCRFFNSVPPERAPGTLSALSVSDLTLPPPLATSLTSPLAGSASACSDLFGGSLVGPPLYSFTYVHAPRTVSLFVFGFHVACLLFFNRFVGAVRTPSTLRNFSCSISGLFSMKKSRSIPSRPFVPTRLLCSMLTSIEDFWECVV